MPTKSKIEGVGEPPDDIAAEKETAAEWKRVVKVADEAGRPLKASDRTLLQLYCRTWSLNRKSYEHVQTFGSVVLFPNTFPGVNPHYKTWKETAAQLRGILADLGHTPASRDFDSSGKSDEPAEPGELEL